MKVPDRSLRQYYPSLPASPKPVVLYDECHSSSYDYTGTQASSVPTAPSIRTNRSHPSVARARQHSSAPSTSAGRRFVAGELFFNYEAFGSLRPELPPIDLFSSEFLGLAVSAFFTGFTFTLLRNGYRQLLAEYIRVDNESLVASTKFLIEWPGCFAIFIGFLSDCRPIRGRRRKPYMILGWACAALLMVAVAVVDFAAGKSWLILDVSNPDRDDGVVLVQSYYGVVLGLTLAATFMLQLMYIPSLSMTVEFAQREPLQHRGKLQAMFLMLFYAAAAVAQGVATTFVLADDEGHVRSTISLGSAALILAGACVAPIPFLIKFLDEPTIEGSVHFSVRRRVTELWRFCHHNVVNRILFFLVAHLFILGIYNGNVREAVAKWSGITPARQPVVAAADTSGYCLALIFWMSVMVNWSWRWIAGVGTIIYVLLYTFFTTSITFNVERSFWFYTIVLTILDMPRAWIKLYAIVLSTEIADKGREGVIMGLVFSMQTMVGLSAHMLSSKLGRWLPYFVSIDEDVVLDSDETRRRVFTGAVITYGINLLSLFVVLVLPNQKLDAQQLRAFGGYNRYASYAIVIGFVLFFTAIFGVNTMSLL